MAGKEYTCVICGETVSKRKSTAYKDGRACKTHTEAQEALNASQAKETKRMRKMTYETACKEEIREKRILRKSKQRQKQRERMGTFIDGHRCWCCAQLGITLQEAMTMTMLGSKVASMKGEHASLLNPRENLEYVGISKDITVIGPHHCNKDYKLHRDIRFYVKGMKIFNLCHDCAKKLNAEPVRPKTENLTMEKMALMASVVDGPLTNLASEVIAKEQGMWIIHGVE